ncbi:MAG: phosphopantothenoylcysteine decarboxylase domain-containing protein [Planctomycetota bacterium]|jgi:phosphopantothenoylcysteine decarboxylase/phosphopantothenate--cysteine ligase
MHFLITAGGTREYIDPVRFVSNTSSGRMGYALARAALKAGHKVTLITTPTSLRIPEKTKTVNVETASQMHTAVKKYFPKTDCLIMAAAVADYTLIKTLKTKIKKSGKGLTLKLKPTHDILRWAAKNKRKNQLVIGFALEDKAVCARAEKKLKEKRLDMIVANTIAAIGSSKTAVQIKRRDSKWLKIASSAKAVIAKKIISMAENM